jgi:hypothetical protein
MSHEQDFTAKLIEEYKTKAPKWEITAREVILNIFLEAKRSVIMIRDFADLVFQHPQIKIQWQSP